MNPARRRIVLMMGSLSMPATYGCASDVRSTGTPSQQSESAGVQAPPAVHSPAPAPNSAPSGSPSSASAGPEAASGCSDGIKNDGETDVDCGGTCPPCAAGLGCAENADCQSSLCEQQICSGYGARVRVGQTPEQLGAFFRGNITGWSWWDSAQWGTEKQKNLIALMVYQYSGGRLRAATGLAAPPSWPQASFRAKSGVYSYKADTGPSPIATQKNYPDQIDLWMLERLDLRAVTSATLSFWTWYAFETDWDYGYVAISTNEGDAWTHLPGTLTTNTDPNGNNLGNGLTGTTSDTWVQETMDLTPYAGASVLLAFRFTSDAATNAEGWYVDDIQVVSGADVIFTDDAETPVPAKSLSVDVTYPHLTLVNPTDPLTDATTLQYTQETQQVELREALGHPGTYLGYFFFEPFGNLYSGVYSVKLDTLVEGQPLAAQTQFQTTLYGCQSCHNRVNDSQETSFVHGDGGGMQSCMNVCHTGSRNYTLVSAITDNPMHVHEMQYGHRGGFVPGAWGNPQPPYDVASHVTVAACTDCHTSFVHDNAGPDTASIASYTLHGTNIPYSSGVHASVACTECHGDLSYPIIPPNQLAAHGLLGDYQPAFTSHESFADTYIVAVDGTQDLSITVSGENTSKWVWMHTVGPVDNTATALQGPCSNETCEVRQSLATPLTLTVASPYSGTWIVTISNLSESQVDYTITSNYPLQPKPIIRIPECNECHNPSATGGAYTPWLIPSWNPGYAHADTNGNGSRDVPCRMCHNAMHEVVTRPCQDCHQSRPAGHPIVEPDFRSMTASRCSPCHGDPHQVSVQRGGEEPCAQCHSL